MSAVPNSAVAQDTEAKLYRRITLRFVPLLVVCFVFAYLDRVNISFAKLQMQSDLGFSDAVYGLGASIFFVGYFLFEIPSNMILHKVGPKRWIARIMITWGIASAAMMFVTSETSFYILRFLIGSLEAGFVPGALYFLHQLVPVQAARPHQFAVHGGDCRMRHDRRSDLGRHHEVHPRRQFAARLAMAVLAGRYSFHRARRDLLDRHR